MDGQSDWPLVMALLITYKRTDLALRTIRAVKEKLDYSNLAWHIADDGSPDGHVTALVEECGGMPTVSNAGRRGVGVSMNMGAAACLERADHILWLEDDWELTERFDLRPCVKLMQEREDIGMVRLGYFSPGIQGTVISGGDRLWWRLQKGDTYTFAGHAALRHRRFVAAYQPYLEGLTPGETELWLCGTFLGREGPDIVIPAFTGQYGVFAHIGGESLNNMRPGT